MSEKRNLKSLREVCKITGVSRRALQGYNEIGLLEPTEIGKSSGYWYYDDAAIMKLMTIQVFSEVGYKRKEIKEFIDEPLPVVDEKVEHARAALSQKKRQIEGLLSLLKILRAVTRMPESMASKVTMIRLDDLIEGESFAGLLQQTAERLTREDKEEQLEYECMMQFGVDLFLLGLLNHNPVRDPDVLRQARELFQHMMDYMVDFARTGDLAEAADITDREWIGFILELINEIMQDPELTEYLDEKYGPGSMDFAREAVNYYVTRTYGIEA